MHSVCRDLELETISTTTNELPSTSQNYSSTDDAGENGGVRRNSMTDRVNKMEFFVNTALTQMFAILFKTFCRNTPKVKDTPERNTFCLKRVCLASPIKPRSFSRKTNSCKKIWTVWSSKLTLFCNVSWPILKIKASLFNRRMVFKVLLTFRQPRRLQWCPWTRRRRQWHRWTLRILLEYFLVFMTLNCQVWFWHRCPSILFSNVPNQYLLRHPVKTSSINSECRRRQLHLRENGWKGIQIKFGIKS